MRGCKGIKSGRSKLKQLMYIFLVLCIVLIICVVHFSSFGPDKFSSKYASQVSKENCIICRERTGFHSGEDNLGIIDLHKGTCHYVQINRYDEHQSMDGYFQIESETTGENGVGVVVQADADRGYANINIRLGDERQIDMDKVSENCCQDCMNYIIDRIQIEGSLFGVAVVNYKNSNVKILGQNMTAFLDGDFYVACKLRKNKMNLLIFYCPVRA